MRVLIYHGQGKKKMSAEDFGAYDVVITTYGRIVRLWEYFNRLNNVLGTLSTEYIPRGNQKNPAPKEPAPIPREHG